MCTTNVEKATARPGSISINKLACVPFGKGDENDSRVQKYSFIQKHTSLDIQTHRFGNRRIIISSLRDASTYMHLHILRVHIHDIWRSGRRPRGWQAPSGMM